MTTENTPAQSSNSNLPDDIDASEADIASLFANQPLPQMKELDDLVLARASSAQHSFQEKGSGKAQKRAPDGSTVQNDNTVDSRQSKVVPFRQRDSFRHVFPGIFAAAAVVVLAVVVVPLIQQSPDGFSTDKERDGHSLSSDAVSSTADKASDVTSDLDSDADSADFAELPESSIRGFSQSLGADVSVKEAVESKIQTDSVVLEGTQETRQNKATTQSLAPTPLEAESTALMESQPESLEFSTSQDQTDAATDINAKSSSSAARTTTISTERSIKPTVETGINITASTTPVFRQTLTMWKEAILEMVTNDKRDEAKRELELLLEHYPQEAKSFKPFAEVD